MPPERDDFVGLRAFQPVTVTSTDELYVQAVERARGTRKKYMKKQRHLSKEERDDLHNPASDWQQCKTGEKCYNASSLVIEDILTKHGVVDNKVVTQVA